MKLLKSDVYSNLNLKIEILFYVIKKKKNLISMTLIFMYAMCHNYILYDGYNSKMLIFSLKFFCILNGII